MEVVDLAHCGPIPSHRVDIELKSPFHPSESAQHLSRGAKKLNFITSGLAQLSLSALCANIGMTLIAAETTNESRIRDIGSTLTQADIEARFHEIESILLLSGYDSMEASRIAALMVFGEDPDSIVGGSESAAPTGPICYWIDVQVHYCDASGIMKSKVLHVQRSCWKTLLGTIGPMCPAPLCRNGTRSVLRFQLLSGCDADVGNSCVVIDNLSWQAQSGSCDRAPAQMACSDCFPSNLCSSWTCIAWSGGAPDSCPSCP